MTKKPMFFAVATLVLGGCAHATGGSSTDSGGAAGSTWSVQTGGSGGSEPTGGSTRTTTSDSTTSSTTTTTSDTGLEDLKALCQASGGQVSRQQCCLDGGEMPDSCAAKPSCGGIVTCADGIDPQLWVCVCPSDQCFGHDGGCVAPG